MQGSESNWLYRYVKDGWSYRQIARYYKKSYGVVYRAIRSEYKRHLRAAGIEPPKTGRPKRIFKTAEYALIAVFRQCNRCGKRVDFVYTNGTKEAARCPRCGDLSLLPGAARLR